MFSPLDTRNLQTTILQVLDSGKRSSFPVVLIAVRMSRKAKEQNHNASQTCREHKLWLEQRALFQIQYHLPWVANDVYLRGGSELLAAIQLSLNTSTSYCQFRPTSHRNRN
jgi:hypothetical protein